MQLVECVPNFSEGRNQKIIDAIADTIRSSSGVNLLDVDPGKSTNRTVYTFVGEPESVLEAAFAAIAKASSLIDMRQHQGAHPRIGAIDVCPFIPVANITMAQCVELANRLGKRVGEELGIPVYLYAEAALSDARKNLADVRAGEYEGLRERMEKGFKPDFGECKFNANCGATVIGARPFLIAYNVNLNTKSQKLANEIALNIREAGKAKRDAQGNIQKNADGTTIKVPGILKAAKAVGWYVEEYKQAQISINLVDYHQTSLQHAFDECCRQAEKIGLRVTGSEIVGLVPLEPMLAAGRHYLAKQGKCTGVPEKELIDIAILSLGLSDITNFDPNKKIIEYSIASGENNKMLKEMTVSNFLDELSSDSPAPGGGSTAALCGALSASLSSMVANLTHGKKGFEQSNELMDQLSNKAQKLKSEFREAIDADTQAFNQIAEARKLPKATEEDKSIRNKAIEDANKEATMVPFKVLDKTLNAVDLAEQLVAKGNPNTLSDVSSASIIANAAAQSAYYNVLINLSGISDKQFCDQMKTKAQEISAKVQQRTDNIHKQVVSKLSSPN